MPSDEDWRAIGFEPPGRQQDQQSTLMTDPSINRPANHAQDAAPQAAPAPQAARRVPQQVPPRPATLAEPVRPPGIVIDGGTGYRLRLAWWTLRDQRWWQAVMYMAPPGPRPRPGQPREHRPQVERPPKPERRPTPEAVEDLTEVVQPQVETRPEEATPHLALRTERWPGRDVAPWQGAPIRRRAKAWQVILRGLVVVLVALLCLTGATQWVRGFVGTNNAAQVAPAAVPNVALFPAAQASGVAQRFTAAYLGWNAATPTARASALTAAGWTGDSAAGWNGQGRQSVDNITTAAITTDSATAGTVTVVATVHAVVGATVKPGRLIALAVPVLITSGSTSIGVPAIVGIPSAGSALNQTSQDNPDSTLTAQTQDQASSFFAAYGTQQDVSGLTAPGSTVRGLGGAVKFAGITGWSVSTPTNGTAKASANVTWQTADGAQLSQSYRLTLQQTTAGDVSRWQVLTIINHS